MKILEFAKESIVQQSKELNLMASRLNESFIKALEIIEECKGHLVVAGIGKSGLIGRKISATFSSIGKASFFIHPTEGGHGDLGSLQDDCVVLAISNSGNQKDILDIIPFLKSRKIPLIVMTGNLQSNLAKLADVVLDISVEKEVCPLNLAPTTSTTATLVMGDALAVSFLKRSNFTNEDFAKRHPKGKLGATLNLSVNDVMKDLDANASFEGTDYTLKEVVIKITDKKLGIAIFHENKKLIGVFTDGDLRRNLSKKDIQLNQKIESLLTKNPRTINENLKAIDAMELMNQYKIESLPVVDDNNFLIGAVHLKDLLGLSI